MNDNGGFTLFELTATVAILAILASAAIVGFRGAMEAAKSTRCKINLRTLHGLAAAYCAENGQYPWGRIGSDEWDFKADGSLGEMFDGDKVKDALCCPKAVNEYGFWDQKKFTGYNYNCFSIGKCEGDRALREAPASVLPEPSRTAMFGDAGWAMGHNKFMRGPRASREFDYSSASVRNAGTQSFRHRGACNVVFADGHVESLKASYKADGSAGYVDERRRTGFIGPDNHIYGGRR